MQKKILILLLSLSLYGANHLVDEPSPYLQQHKNNPVDWYPWNDRALQRAKQEHKLIFLSLGYSTCHWCHVMAREDFEDKEIAKLLNRSFISIKIDKEEYPQLDAYYQKIYQKLRHKGGGWPLTIILTEDEKPLFAGTYIPKYPSYGSKGLVHILKEFALLSQKQRQLYAKKIQTTYLLHDEEHKPQQSFQKDLMLEAQQHFRNLYDVQNKGFGTHPKFPHPAMLLALLHSYQLTHNKQLLLMVENTLTVMVKSGLYDQIDGGFFRYCVDAKWNIPHFEKMLYTNAELIEVYTLAYKITHNTLYKQVVQESIRNIEQNFGEDGIYKSATNAESPNNENILEEGYYFLFRYDTTLDYLVKHMIKVQDAKQALAYFGIEEDGNIDGELSNPHKTFIAPPYNSVKIKKLLHLMRKQRTYPFIDYKRNTAWNALYISAKLYSSVCDSRYKKEALQSLKKLLTYNMKKGELYHISVKGASLTKAALLEDYAFVTQALLQAYQLTLDKYYLHVATKLLQKAKKKFYKKHQWYLSDDTFRVIATMQDGSYRSALAVLMQNYLFVGSIVDIPEFYTLQKESLQKVRSSLSHHTPYYATAFDLYLKNHYGIYIIKSKKKNFIALLDYNFAYPFVYFHIIDTISYEVCGVRSCYMNTKDVNQVKKMVK